MIELKSKDTYTIYEIAETFRNLPFSKQNKIFKKLKISKVKVGGKYSITYRDLLATLRESGWFNYHGIWIDSRYAVKMTN